MTEFAKKYDVLLENFKCIKLMIRETQLNIDDLKKCQVKRPLEQAHTLYMCLLDMENVRRQIEESITFYFENMRFNIDL